VKTYHLYLIQDDIAKTYFGREFLLFDLFSRFSNANSLTEKKVLYKQIQFVTKPIKTIKLHHRIEQALQNSLAYKKGEECHLLYGEKEECCTLRLYHRHVEIHSQGSGEWETIFFEVLRKNEDTFLAMNYQERRYGWLNPIKQERKFV
jgi:hypothetical protein